jgi:hypothetical protein
MWGRSRSPVSSSRGSTILRLKVRTLDGRGERDGEEVSGLSGGGQVSVSGSFHLRVQLGRINFPYYIRFLTEPLLFRVFCCTSEAMIGLLGVAKESRCRAASCVLCWRYPLDGVWGCQPEVGDQNKRRRINKHHQYSCG